MTTSFKKMLAARLTAGTHPGNVYSGMAVMLVMLLMMVTSCRRFDGHDCNDCDCLSKDYKQTNLVADTAGFGAAHIDQNLLNAWGLAVGPTGAFWISSNGTDQSVIYDKDGNTLRAPVRIPAFSEKGGSAPSGVVFNNTNSFGGAHFIFATESGTIVAWTSGDSGVIKVDRSRTNAVYKGITIANDNGSFYIYATNFHDGTVDIYDSAFNLIVYNGIHDPNIPAGFAPFNIKNIDGLLYITYAKQKPDKHDDQAGPGNGYVDVFKPDGSFVRRFASQGTLNSPWGITEGCTGFAGLGDDVILIGNFGDGRINAYNENGTFLGQLKKGNAPLQIDGLWALESHVTGAGNKIFFTAGPNGESHGLFGYIQKN
ncbi:TIGR03118 family protein [Chitinophaga flava]|uniref:TIGR03118 family protein n=1 Tax=Chitinophaga flava TaxID=2259036 RepID=A0A365Y273_9BACT|nr:TIGR03118 family protein [Chitinophaga flava]RBL92408.1 TIGR03118 family protein [Chitinophaga flava]